MTTSDRYDVLAVPVPGGELTVGRWAGRDGAPVVLAVHGITANHLSWAVVAAALAGEVSLLAPDLRGRGGSAGLPAPYGMAAHAADLIAVLDHLGLDRVVLAGHSMGAFVTTTTAVRHPDRVAAVILVDGGLAMAVPPAGDTDAMLTAALGPAMERLAMTFPDRPAYTEFWQSHPALSQHWTPAVEAYVQYDLVGTVPELRSSCTLGAIRADGSDIMLRGEVIDAVQFLTCPATLLWCERGLQGEAPGVYDEHRIAAAVDVDTVTVQYVPELNHYTVLLSEPGARLVADAILAAVPGAQIAPGRHS